MYKVFLSILGLLLITQCTYEKEAEKVDVNKEPVQKEVNHLVIGNDYFLAGDYESALHHYSEAIILDTEELIYYNELFENTLDYEVSL